jgi:hypothetical protein
MNLKFLTLLIFTCSFVFAGEFVFDDKDDFSKLKRKGIRIVRASAKNYKLELSPKKSEANTELLLNFENKKATELKDATGNYTVNASMYAVEEGKAGMGKRYASFAANNSYISVATNNGRLLNSVHFTQPFYISFLVMPGESEQYSVVFKKSLITGGRKFGIECDIVNNKIEVQFNNMFSYSKTESRSFQLKSPDKLKTEEWTHVIIAIDPMTGKASLFEDGKSKSEFEAIKSPENPTSLPFGFHPNDTTPLLIGKDFFGKLDQFLIGVGTPELDKLTEPFKGVSYDDTIKFANQFKGIAYSPVLQTKNSFSRLLSFDHDAIKPTGTQLEIHFRISNLYFTEDDSEVEWIDSSDFKKAMERDFKYLQWKLILRSDYSGKTTPSLNTVRFRYVESLPPNPPAGLKVVENEKNPLGVCLVWVSNHEDNVREGGKYLIHYGVSPDRMVGTIAVREVETKKEGTEEKVKTIKPITGLEEGMNLTQAYKSLKQCVDNDLITLNAVNRKDKNLLVFKPGLTYYFKISACNKNYNEVSGLDQKSVPSNSVQFTFKNQTNH